MGTSAALGSEVWDLAISPSGATATFTQGGQKLLAFDLATKEANKGFDFASEERPTQYTQGNHLAFLDEDTVSVAGIQPFSS